MCVWRGGFDRSHTVQLSTSHCCLSRIMSENDRTEELKEHASKQRLMQAHLWVCVLVLGFVCLWKIGWRHICRCGRTLLLLSGTADGCLSNAPVRMPVHTTQTDAKCSYLPNFGDQGSTFWSFLIGKTLISTLEPVATLFSNACWPSALLIQLGGLFQQRILVFDMTSRDYHAAALSFSQHLILHTLCNHRSEVKAPFNVYFRPYFCITNRVKV